MLDRGHVLQLPKFILILRCVQAGFALIILGLSAYAVSQLPISGCDLAIYASLSALIVTVYMIVAELRFTVIYNYWAFMALDIYQVIVWLVAMAVTASEISYVGQALKYLESNAGGAGDYPVVSGGSGDSGSGDTGSGDSGSGSECYDGYCFSYRKRQDFSGDTSAYDPVYYGKLDTLSKGKAYRGIVGAVAGVSGLQMVLFGVTLGFIVMAILAHRRAGGRCKPGSAPIMSRARKTSLDVEQQYEPLRHQQLSPQPPQQSYAANEPQYPPVQPPQQYGSEAHYAPVEPPQPYASPEPQYPPVQPPQPYASPEPQYPHVQPPAPY